MTATIPKVAVIALVAILANAVIIAAQPDQEPSAEQICKPQISVDSAAPRRSG